MEDFTKTKCIDLQLVGGDGGGVFDNFKEDGSLISRIDTWADVGGNWTVPLRLRRFFTMNFRDIFLGCLEE
ncbi:hypothetical protein BXU11_09225 [Flavobacterium sp. LM5]|uniref:hypothetical protein n=1 Tax=Flavobacterium sp. LM5 TaxID=1938610 RepID=UPI0009941DCE|nr:hypothetical protein [Flavobacterium sp. LM5]OOV27634.1 hypothetical protein BXU11_09225 [Flavobacterium sp. LM5]